MELTLGRSLKPQKLTKKNIPVKRSINLAHAGEKKRNYSLAVLSLILLVLCLGLFSKYAVYDRILAVDRAQAEVANVQRQIDNGYAAIDSYGELAIKYAHFTYSGMTEAELSLADRVAVLEMLNRLVLPTNYVESWTLQGNLLTLYISGNTLQELNLVTQLLEKDDLVDYCTVTTASTNDMDNIVVDAFAEVTAQLQIHLKSSEEVYW
ncbi:MAG: hypothetical protein K6G54_01435 [Oscillospiraceae bacterium]|nr:hypothetical protein [Oscillospiraceae bacterium]